MNIKELRTKTGLTQTEFGRRIGVSLATIQKLEAENNDRKPTETIKKLIRYEFSEYVDSPLTPNHANETAIPYGEHGNRIVVNKEEIELKDRMIALLEDNHKLKDEKIKHLESQILILTSQLESKNMSQTSKVANG